MDTEFIKEKYERRIVKLLNEQRAELGRAGLKTSTVSDWSDSEYAWQYVIYAGKKHNSPKAGDIDVTFTIVESEEREGIDEGIAFGLNLVEYEGRIVGGMTPYNYSGELWIPLENEDAIEARFNLFEEADNDSLVELVKEFQAR